MNISKAQIKHLRSLKLKKFREKYGEFAIEGDKLLHEALRDRPESLTGIYALPSWLAAMAEKGLKKTSAPIYPITQTELERISSLSTPNQVLATVKMPPSRPFSPPTTGWAFYLDGLRDPGNLGTIWRIADWFGFRQIIASPDTVDFYNPKVIQASMGAFLRVPATTATHEELANLDKEKCSLWGADMEGLPFGKWNPPPTGLLVIGSEAHGLSPRLRQWLQPRLRQWLQGSVSIPRAPHSRAESLNASVAAGILASKVCETSKT